VDKSVYVRNILCDDMHAHIICFINLFILEFDVHLSTIDSPFEELTQTYFSISRNSSIHSVVIPPATTALATEPVYNVEVMSLRPAGIDFSFYSGDCCYIFSMWHHRSIKA
jgi:hypothetical protein